MREFRVLYLWAGKERSGTKAWEEDRAEIISVGIDIDADLTICRDIIDVSLADLEQYAPFDFIWASPDCKVWSLANLHSGHWKKNEWSGEFEPQTPKAKGMIKRVKHTLWLIEQLQPTYWVMENPFGILRHMKFMKQYMRADITYCRYGDDRMKPTDLWGRFPRGWRAFRCGYGDKCHPPAPRSSHTTGTESRDYDGRVRIPIGLSRSIYNAILSADPYGSAWFTLEDFV